MIRKRTVSRLCGSGGSTSRVDRVRSWRPVKPGNGCGDRRQDVRAQVRDEARVGREEVVQALRRTPRDQGREPVHDQRRDGDHTLQSEAQSRPGMARISRKKTVEAVPLQVVVAPARESGAAPRGGSGGFRASDRNGRVSGPRSAVPVSPGTPPLLAEVGGPGGDGLELGLELQLLLEGCVLGVVEEAAWSALCPRVGIAASSAARSAARRVGARRHHLETRPHSSASAAPRRRPEVIHSKALRRTEQPPYEVGAAGVGYEPDVDERGDERGARARDAQVAGAGKREPGARRPGRSPPRAPASRAHAAHGCSGGSRAAGGRRCLLAPRGTRSGPARRRTRAPLR